MYSLRKRQLNAFNGSSRPGRAHATELPARTFSFRRSKVDPNDITHGHPFYAGLRRQKTECDER